MRTYTTRNDEHVRANASCKNPAIQTNVIKIAHLLVHGRIIVVARWNRMNCARVHLICVQCDWHWHKRRMHAFLVHAFMRTYLAATTAEVAAAARKEVRRSRIC